MRAHGGPMPLFCNTFSAARSDSGDPYGATIEAGGKIMSLALYLESLQRRTAPGRPWRRTGRDLEQRDQPEAPMHPNPAFRQATSAQNLAFARARSFGLLAVNAAEGPLISHIPFQLAEDCLSLDLHLVRSNPIARLLATPQPATLAITGPEGYVSPDWYGLEDQVPTWNYVAVHLRGTLSLLPEDELRPLIDRLSAQFESRLAPKAPWTSSKMPPATMDRLMRMIVPCRMTVDEVQGTWKLAQNKPEAARLAAADGLESAALAPEAAALAALMRNA